MGYKDYVCPTCKTKYVSTNGEKPQGIKWNDGHECDPRSENPDPVEQEANIPNISSYVSEYADPTYDPLFYDAYGNNFGDA